jgi:hypothetical protein
MLCLIFFCVCAAVPMAGAPENVISLLTSNSLASQGSAAGLLHDANSVSNGAFPSDDRRKATARKQEAPKRKDTAVSEGGGGWVGTMGRTGAGWPPIHHLFGLAREF